MPRETIWTEEVRRALYQLLVKHFGPYSSWENVRSPGGGQDKAFEQFLNAFAFVAGAKSADAVLHQILFALPQSESGKGSTWTSQASTAILNIAFAYEAEFIENRHLPHLLAVSANNQTEVAEDNNTQN
jgi:hypothetical protein